MRYVPFFKAHAVLNMLSLSKMLSTTISEKKKVPKEGKNKVQTYTAIVIKLG